MNELPKRSAIRLTKYDYSTPGAYFITVCVSDRKPVLWNVGAAISRPPLSRIGIIVDAAINQILDHYQMVSVEKYCIMPDHIHMILSINTDENGRQVAAPTIPRVVGHMKRWVSMQVGHSIWQKSFVDRVIRNPKGYRAVWEYIDNNPVKLDTADDMPDFENM